MPVHLLSTWHCRARQQIKPRILRARAQSWHCMPVFFTFTITWLKDTKTLERSLVSLTKWQHHILALEILLRHTAGFTITEISNPMMVIINIVGLCQLWHTSYIGCWSNTFVCTSVAYIKAVWSALFICVQVTTFILFVLHVILSYSNKRWKLKYFQIN